MFRYCQRMVVATLGMCSLFLITAGSSYGNDQQEQAFIRAFNESRANYRICQLYSEGFNGVRQHCQGDPEIASNALRKRCVAYYKLEAANKMGCRELFQKLLQKYSASGARTASEQDRLRQQLHHNRCTA